MPQHRTGLALICASLAFLACSPAQAGAEPASDTALIHAGKLVKVPEKSPYRARIAVDTAKQENLAHEVTVPGVVEADPAGSVNVLPALSGRLIRLDVRLGDSVRKGQELARLQSSDLLQAGSDLQKARDAYRLAVAARDRALGVFQSGGNAVKDKEQAESAVVQAQSEMTRAEQRLQSYGVKLGERQEDLAALSLPIVAPISGTVTALNVGANATINDPTAALLSIANLDEVFVTAQVPEDLIAQIRVGQPLQASTNAWPDKALRGKVESINAVLDPDTRRTRVRARFANPGRLLLPNMFASVKFSVSQTAQTIVPLSALVMSNDRVLVFVETSPWEFEIRQVELGVEERDVVRVRRGVKPGERIVVRGGVLLND
ncbi:MAG: efflux RND transporter periplasmic adaptor subunit [Curvibacter sp.]|nr:efflux RND transporter periplasmic adaptor subunit [Curvibacter sp.]